MREVEGLRSPSTLATGCREQWCFQPYLSLGDLRFNRRPCFTLSSITKEVHDDGAFGNGLIHLKKIAAWDPTILLSFFPRRAILSHTDDHVQPVVAEVETLTVPLRTVADECEGIVFEVFL